MPSFARSRTRLRAALVAAAVAVATIVAVLGAYSRAPHELLGIAFARACAAESAMMERTQSRLRVDDEGEHIEDTDALLPSTEAGKARSPRDRAEGLAPRRATAFMLRRRDVPSAGREGGPGIERIPLGTPARQRARLMVFLN